jgi:prepilin-type N-terminal cleavage/methylation domain-containing protein
MSKRAFSLVELLVVVFVIVVAVAVVLPAIQPHHGGCSRQMKDATQVRGMLQAMVVWAGQNKGKYPLPSELDLQDATVAGVPALEKDNTGNILSILIYTGGISTDLCINPAESNTGKVEIDGGYTYDSPSGAANPANALWDPGFAGTPEDDPGAHRRAPGMGNQSYAHILPFGNRLSRWSDTYTTTEAAFGDRGPEYIGTTYPANGKWKLVAGAFGVDSNPLLIHGSRVQRCPRELRDQTGARRARLPAHDRCGQGGDSGQPLRQRDR